MKRYWINQPSIFQPLHKHHGLEVMADVKTENSFVIVYPNKGDVLSLRIPSSVLSSGWPSTKKET